MLIELLGWSGAALVLTAYAQHDALHLRRVGLAAGALLIAYNVARAAWPTVTMEVVLAGINARRLMQARSGGGNTRSRERHSQRPLVRYRGAIAPTSGVTEAG